MALFLDHCSSIYEHSSDNFTVSVQYSPSNKCFLAVSLSSFSIFSAEEIDKKIIVKYFLTENEKNEMGYFSQAIWINSTVLCCLMTNGNIMIFNFIQEKSDISVKYVIKPKANSLYTAISAFFSYIIAGNDNGDIVIISPQNPSKAIYHHLIDFPIKKICTNASHGILLSANRLAYHIHLNREVLVDPNFDFQFQEIPVKHASEISISQTNTYGSVLDPSGFIYVSNFKDYENKFKMRTPTLSATFIWTNDGSNLFTIFKDGSITLISTISRGQRRLKCDELANSNCGSIGKNHLFVATKIGLCNVPLVTNSKNSSYPLVYSPSMIYTFRATQRKAYTLPFAIDDKYMSIIKQIEYCVADKEENFIACSGSNKTNIIILKQINNSWFLPKQQTLFNCRGLSWMKDNLCCLSFSTDTVIYTLTIYKVDEKNETLIKLFTYNLPSHPLYLSSDDNYCVVSLVDKILVFSQKKLLYTFNLSGTPLYSIPYSKDSYVFVLYNNRKLVLCDLKNKSETNVADDISDFLIDDSFGIIFTQKDLRIRLSSVKKIKFGPFIETADIPIGIFSRCTSLMLIQSATKPPFTTSLNPFFDLSIVKELQDPENAARIVMPLSGTQQFGILLRQVSVFALREKLGRKLVPFLQHFPNEMNESLASALRAVESPERVGVFEVLGPCSKIFMEMADLKTEIGGSNIIKFIPRSNDKEGDTFTAALLLPVIMEEEGPIVAFPASIYILGKSHTKIDFVESLVRFLDPLISGGKETTNGMVDCVGMEMTRSQYVELYARMMATFDNCLFDLMKSFQPDIAIQFATAAKLDISSSLRKNTKIDENSDINVILDKVAPLITNQVLSRKEAAFLAQKTLNGGWFSWSAALSLLAGDTQSALSILSQIPRMRHQLNGSQWQYLIDL